jgi:hypothetical protein
MANFQKLQLSLILTVAGQIWGILQISAVICRILQIREGSANSKPKFHSKKLAKVCSQKILQSIGVEVWFSVRVMCVTMGLPLLLPLSGSAPLLSWTEFRLKRLDSESLTVAFGNCEFFS